MSGRVLVARVKERAIGRFGHRGWGLSLLWLLGCGLISSLACLVSAFHVGATFDEPLYLSRGLDGWRSGSHRGLLRVGTMPLPADVQTFPLYLAERWRGQPWDVEADFDVLLPWFRAGTLVFWWLLLTYALLIGHSLGGPWAGRFAVALLACEPNLLAHAGLGTTDVALTACLLALTYHFRKARGTAWLWRVGLPMLWFALTLLAKASGLVFGPLCLLVVELDRLYLRPRVGPTPADTLGTRGWWGRLLHDLRPFRRDAWQIGLGGLALAFVFCGCDFQPEPSFVAWAHGLPEGGSKPLLAWIADHLCVFSNAGEGLVRQIKHNMHGHGTFLLGASQDRAFWYYFPVLLTIKLPSALLLLTAALTLWRPRTLVNWAVLTAAALLLFSFTCRVQIGIRLILPLVALLGIGLAVALVQARTELTTRWQRRLFSGVGAVVLAWMALDCVLVWPNALCHVNEFWGGSRDGYLLVSDSNYDWGQGVPELARWRRAHPGGPLDVWYFGTDPRLAHLDVCLVPLHQLPLERPEEVRRYLHGGRLAVSTSLVYGHGLTEPSRQAAAFLRRLRRVDRTTTFLIYDLRSATDTGAEGRQGGGAP